MMTERSVKIMAVLNLTPDSFWEPSRSNADRLMEDVERLVSKGAEIIDIGAVSTRPGAAAISLEQEWERLEPAMKIFQRHRTRPLLSIDTTRSEIISRCCDYVGHVMVNDISAGEDDPAMLPFCASHGLTYVAMHKRGTPLTMDSLTDYPSGVMRELLSYFRHFAAKAEDAGLEDWILDPGLGFAKTSDQNWEILERLLELSCFGRPILIGASDKRFTGGDNERAESMAIANGATIIRKHL